MRGCDFQLPLKASVARSAGRALVLLLALAAGASSAAEGGSDASGSGETKLAPPLLLGHLPFVAKAGQAQLTLTGLRFADDFPTRTVGAVFLDYGVTEQLTLSASTRYLDTRSGDGLGRSTVGVLYNVLGRKSPVILSLGGDIAFPTQSDALDSSEKDRIVVEPRVLAGRQFGPAALWATGATTLADNREPEWRGAAIATYVLPRGTAILEVVGEEGGGRDPYYLAPGLAHAVTSHLTLVGAAPLGLNDDAADWAGLVKIVYTLP